MYEKLPPKRGCENLVRKVLMVKRAEVGCGVDVRKEQAFAFVEKL